MSKGMRRTGGHEFRPVHHRGDTVARNPKLCFSLPSTVYLEKPTMWSKQTVECSVETKQLCTKGGLGLGPEAVPKLLCSRRLVCNPHLHGAIDDDHQPRPPPELEQSWCRLSSPVGDSHDTDECSIVPQRPLLRPSRSGRYPRPVFLKHPWCW